MKTLVNYFSKRVTSLLGLFLLVSSSIAEELIFEAAGEVAIISCTDSGAFSVSCGSLPISLDAPVIYRFTFETTSPGIPDPPDVDYFAFREATVHVGDALSVIDRDSLAEITSIEAGLITITNDDPIPTPIGVDRYLANVNGFLLTTPVSGPSGLSFGFAVLALGGEADFLSSSDLPVTPPDLALAQDLDTISVVFADVSTVTPDPPPPLGVLARVDVVASVDSFDLIPPGCGDGIVDSENQCDDGRNSAGTCANTCREIP